MDEGFGHFLYLSSGPAGVESPRGCDRPASVSYEAERSSTGSSDSASPRSTSSLMDFSTTKHSPGSLKLDLDKMELNLTATVSRESLLDELLGDIRRSCATSLASTPTMVSLSEGEGENVFECRLRRSEAELRTLGEGENQMKWIMNY